MQILATNDAKSRPELSLRERIFIEEQFLKWYSQISKKEVFDKTVNWWKSLTILQNVPS